MTPKPGEIYLETDDGSGERHSAIVVSHEAFNRGQYVVAVPLTSRKFESRAGLPNCVPLYAGQYGRTRNCVAQAEMVSVYDKADLELDLGPTDTLDDVAMRSLIHAIGYVLSADCEPA